MITHQEFSERAKHLLLAVKKRRSSSSAAQWVFEYSGSGKLFQTDKILTLKVSQSSSDDFEAIFEEVFSRIFQEKTIASVFLTNFRETESFLRDSNHLAAFSPENLERAKAAFDIVKKDFLVSILLCFSGSERQTKWSELSFVERNRTLLSLFLQLENLFFRPKSLELVFAEGCTVTVKKGDLPLENDVLELFLARLFKFDLSDSPLKVIGTL